MCDARLRSRRRANAAAPVAAAQRAPGANAIAKTIAARERARTFTPNKRRAPASAIFFTYLRRGELHRDPCETCGRATSSRTGPTSPSRSTSLWFCRIASRERTRAAGGRTERLAEEATATLKVVAWKTLGERFAAEWPQLAPDLQARLRAEVERSSAFRIVRANPESPLYRQQLVAAFGRYCASLEPASSE